MYDSGGCHDYDPLLQQQNWQTCISEVFAEFMNSNYEPVMSALELLNRQTPAGLGVDRDAIRLALSQLRDFIVAGQVRYDLIQPELIQLKQLRSGQRLSIFDILGRMRSSLQMTRVVLQIFRKSLIGPPDSSADESAEEDSGAMMTEGDKENVRSAVFESTVTGNSGVADQQLASPPASTANQPHSITCDCLDGAISILQRAEDGLQSMQSFRKRWLW
jgi:hypothetical protein